MGKIFLHNVSWMSWLLCIGIMLPVGILAQEGTPKLADNEVTITYVANHGFLIATADKKIMLDTLFESGDQYVSPTAEMLTMMQAGKEPFDRVDLVLVTHNHGDHFSATRTRDVLQGNPNATFVAPAQAVTPMKTLNGYDSIAAQIVEIAPVQKSERVAKTSNGIDLEILGISHHLDSSVQHLAYLLTVNGIKILHLGDAAKQPNELYQNLKLADEAIDILIAPFGSDCSNWMVTVNGDGLAKIRDFIKPRHILMGHLPKEFDQPKTDAALKELQQLLPGITLSVMHPVQLTRKVYTKQNGELLIKDASQQQSKTTADPEILQKALLEAIRQHDQAQVKALLEQGAGETPTKANLPPARSPLVVAGFSDQFDIAALLVEHGADVNTMYRSQYCSIPALMLAIQADEPAFATWLIEHGADVNLASSRGMSPLIMAACQGYVELVKLLLEKGADVNANAPDINKTALIMAARRGYTEIVKVLLAHGADPGIVAHIQTEAGPETGTALELAAKHNHTEIVELLKAADKGKR